MKNVASINDQILSAPEKAVEFFIAFFKAKRKKRKLSENEIPFTLPVDLKPASLKPTSKELQRSDEIIKAFHAFGKRQSIKLPSYKSFRNDVIVSALQDEILLFEISRRILVTTENSLLHIGISLTNEIFRQMGIDAISEAFAREMLLIYLRTIKVPVDHLSKEISISDPFQVNAKYFDRHFYYKQKGKLWPFEMHTSPDHLADYYLQNGNDVLHCKTMKAEAMLEVTIYQEAGIEDQKLVINKNTIEDTLYIPQTEAGSFFAGLDTLKKNNEIESGEEGIAIASYIDAFQRYNVEDASELMRRCVIHFYRMIRGGFPAFTEEQVESMTGFLCVQLGILKFQNLIPKEKSVTT
jgi:hypothetical protein